MYIRTHSAIAASLSLLILNPSLEELPTCLVFSTLGSILPDIDHDYTASKHIFPSLIILYFLCFYFNITLFNINLKFIIGIISLIPILISFYLSKHRTISHSIIGILLISTSVYLINPIVISPFFLGYSFHLIADSFTKTGVRFFYPLKKTSYGLKVINMHTTIDYPFFILSCLIFFIILIYKYNIVNYFLYYYL